MSRTSGITDMKKLSDLSADEIHFLNEVKPIRLLESIRQPASWLANKEREAFVSAIQEILAQAVEQLDWAIKSERAMAAHPLRLLEGSGPYTTTYGYDHHQDKAVTMDDHGPKLVTSSYRVSWCREYFQDGDSTYCRNSYMVSRTDLRGGGWMLWRDLSADRVINKLAELEELDRNPNRRLSITWNQGDPIMMTKLEAS